MLSEILIIVIRGIAIGSIFATIAMSFNIVHGATNIFNFAQGNMFIRRRLRRLFPWPTRSGLASGV